MELRIRDSQQIIDEAFGKWLIPRIKTKLISSISRYKFANWDNYLSTSDNIPRLYEDKEYTAASIIIFAANELVCQGGPGEIVIEFNTNDFVPGYDRLKLTTIIKTINYGTLDIKGCPIFTDVLDHFARHISTYARLYYRL